MLVTDEQKAQYGQYIGKLDEFQLARYFHLGKEEAGDPYRVLYAFDPKRCAILLLGGNKIGDDRWYEKNIPVAERLYHQHFSTLKAEEKNHD